ncbi:hypothetical protein [Pantoea cypripedii]|uniref:CopG family transcriptional regulator n=1 Tax=Pantoea cypripedii TaxID=55209 RepID=A0A6B9GAJ2_PANCY|nr:hypothetical protein [Pantoea cypripedii]QGY29366.1 hypothetical protein CUN67_10650 [Pantoea cypripedii]
MSNNGSKQREIKLSFPDEEMAVIFSLAETRKYGSAHTIIKRAVSDFVKTVNSKGKEYPDDRNNPVK